MPSSNSLSLSMIALAGATALSSTMAAGLIGGCTGDQFVVGTSDDGGDGGTGGDGGMGGEGGTSVLGTQYIPKFVSPTLGQTLTPTHAFLSWSAAPAVPDGKTFDHYEVCWATGMVIDLGSESQCPNGVSTAKTYSVIDSLKAGTQYFCKVRAVYTDGDRSFFTSAHPFLTDSSLIGWWPFDGNVDDRSGNSHNGGLKNGAVHAAALLNQGLSLDGIDDNAAITDTDPFNFGTGDFALSAWVYPQRDGVAEAIVSKRSATNGYEIFRTAAGKAAFYGANCGIAVTGGDLPSGQWSRVTAVRSVDAVSLYINNSLSASGTCSDNFVNAAALTFGCAGAALGCVEPFKGMIDEATARKNAPKNSAILNEYCAERALSGASPLPAACQ